MPLNTTETANALTKEAIALSARVHALYAQTSPTSETARDAVVGAHRGLQYAILHLAVLNEILEQSESGDKFVAIK